MTLIKDLINIPDHVAGGSFVLALAEGVERAEETVNQYVVTDQIVESFDKALKFIRDAVGAGGDSPRSKAAYLHGSFGSGKSHFMAVLDLLLAGNTHARSIPELAPIIGTHDTWMQSNNFLLVPYHLIGADNLESAILGGYVDYVRKNHPDAELPPVYESDLVLDNASSLRERMGDEAFFAELNEGSSGGDGGGRWGTMTSGWDAARFDAAIIAPHADDDRLSLVSVVVSTLLTAFKDMHSGFVSLDDGLSIISRHAQSLGYDALVLFLDELILWLAGKLTVDVSIAGEEGAKIAKLVESGDADRPIPLISFIARQRDLRELVGSSATGAEELVFFEALQWWEGRFDRINLEDTNLPVIANRRMLKANDANARSTLDQAFDDAFRSYSAAADVLLGDESDRKEHARLVYPFSPALVTTLVDVSSVLQRNRTALKVMQALLVDQRETLRVGELIPVGDLYGVIAAEDQPFSESMQLQFDNAKSLYARKLRPTLLARHGLGSDANVDELAPKHPFRGEDRLVKTVLLAALVPATPALENLTASRLEALNAGSIESFIPGDELSEVIALFRELGSSVGEIELAGDDANPRISVRLHGIDTDTIIAGAKQEDNPSSRRRKIRDLLSLAVDEEKLFDDSRHKLQWRGTKREIEIVFGNIRDVRELPDGEFVAGNSGKIVIDFPFDPENLAPINDVARAQTLKGDIEDTATICWLPSHLNEAMTADLGRLVVLDYLLVGDNFDRNAGHLPSDDRIGARRNLESQRNNLRTSMLAALEEAYSVRSVSSATRYIEEPLPARDQFISLHHGLDARRPAASDLKDAIDKLSDQLLGLLMPAHPDFGDREVSGADLAKVWEAVQRAAQQPNGRLEFARTESRNRDLLARIATPLGLGDTGANHFVLGDDWKNSLTSQISAARSDDPTFVPTVGWLRECLDKPEVRGLPKEVANLVIATFAMQTDHVFTFAGGVVDVDLKRLDDGYKIEQQALPEQGDWESAVANTRAIFGLEGSDYRSADNLTRLVERARSGVSEHREDVAELRTVLLDQATQLGIDASSNRIKNAEAAATLVGKIETANSSIEVAQVMANVELPTSATALGASISSASAVIAVLSNSKWAFVEKAAELGDRGEAIRAEISTVAAADEFVTSLVATMKRLVDEAENIVLAASTIASPDPAPAVKSAGGGRVDRATKSDAEEKIRNALSEVTADQRVTVTWEIHDS